MNVNYDYYRIFYFVGRYGSFTRAAQILENNQPNITRAMNNLEAQLGTVLFLRSKRGVTLTDEGKKLYERVRLAYEQLSLAEQEIEAAKNMESGIVTVGVSEIALHEVLIPVLAGFRKKYPKIIIRVTNESSPGAIQSVQNDAVDFSIVTSPLQQYQHCRCQSISSFTEVPIVKKGMMAETKRLSLTELAARPLIMLAEGTGSRRFYEDYFARFGLVLNPQVIAATADQILPMVKAGFGIGFLPESMIGKEEDIVKLELSEPIPGREVVLISKENKVFPNAAKKLLECVVGSW